MIRKFSQILFLLALIASSLYPFKNAEAVAADCVIKSATWAKTNSNTVGEVVDINISGENCSGWGTDIKIYKKVSLSSDPIVGQDTKTFSSSNTIKSGFTVTGESYLNLYIVATAGSSRLESDGKTSGNLIIDTRGLSTPAPTTTPTPTPGGGSGGAGGGSSGGGTSSFDFSLKNPLKADSLLDFIDLAMSVLFNLAIPVAVVLILWAGFQILTSSGEPAKVKKGKDILWAVVIGLAIIMIGRGFVTFIMSVLDISGPGGNIPGQGQYVCNFNNTCVIAPDGNGIYSTSNCDNKCGTGSGSSSTTAAVSGVLGSACSSNSQCGGGLVCNNSMCLQANGSKAGGPCLVGAHCDYGFTCNSTSTGKQTVAGREVGTCFAQSSSAGVGVGQSCSSSNKCVSGLSCDSGICKRPDGNVPGEACTKDSHCDYGFCSGDSSNPGVCTVRKIGQTCSKSQDCDSGLKCNVICQRETGNLSGEACDKRSGNNGDKNCANGTVCAVSGSGNLGTCITGSR